MKQAAQRAGISPTTLRAWERRYDVLDPGRTPAGYRIYDDSSLDRLRTMAALVHSGWSPAKAAEHIREQVGDDRDDVPRRRRPDGTVPDPAYLQLAEIAERLDTAALQRLLEEKFAAADPEDMLIEWLIPSLAEVGLAWAEEEAGVAGEHVVSSAVVGRLSHLLQQTPVPDDAPHVMVGLPQGAHHEVGALVLAILLQRRGARVQYVSADLPADEWVRGAVDGRAAAAVVVVPMVQDVEGARQALHALRVHGPRLTLFVGGGSAGDLGDRRIRRLAEDFRGAADMVAQAVGAIGAAGAAGGVGGVGA